MSEIPIHGATFIIVRPDNTILMQLRDSKPQRYPNTWCFPGGTIEDGETPVEAALREIKEEYGLILDAVGSEEIIPIELMKYTLSYERNAVVYIFEVTQDVDPVLNEGADMQWMTINEIEKLDLAFEQDQILPKLRQHIESSH